ncbi:ABC transporter ATP-binding protein [Sciscionella sediminilitoris]|uniref:ABC transporter ATP-binding protein n=1 Tax=Sciscionella sediminilitoris TaxID=1445613 RepID=UPI0004DF5D46|nr:ABC transporter ATP-binding protein [Sciscionella sp. SE31]
MTQAPTGSVVEIRGLRCHYGAYEAVRGVDLQVRRGEVFALLGTNGAGKTTTLEVLSGFHARTGGTVSVLGVDPASGMPELRARMGIMQQEGGFIAELSVAETLRLWQRLTSRPDDPERLLARFDLAERAAVRVAKLSGGERRRLDLALAVWGSPELVILDEPTTGLDPESRRRSWDAIGELTEAGRTVILTTHYLDEAEALADRLAIMHRGRIAATGTLAEVIAARPAGFSARIPGAATQELPELGGAITTAVSDDATVIAVSTEDLQADLTRFLGWADSTGIRLEALRAAPASLAEIYHSVRAADAEQEG